MLSFLLFAGGLHIDFSELRRSRVAIAALKSRASDGPHKAPIIIATYVVVLFSVLIQSSAVGVVATRLFST